jgi:S-adenosylmethionine/arginine decarboxylase-like enzyme
MNIHTSLSPIIESTPRGQLHQLDFTWSTNTVSNKTLAKTVYQIIEKAINRTSLLIVHENLTMLPIEDFISEAGWTLFFSLDSSHCSAHCYYDSKLMAIDVFSCGSSNIRGLIDDITDDLRRLLPTIECSFYTSNERFHTLNFLT